MKGTLPKKQHALVVEICEELKKRMKVLGGKPKLLSVLTVIERYQNSLVGVPVGNVDLPSPERRDTLRDYDSEVDSDT